MLNIRIHAFSYILVPIIPISCRIQRNHNMENGITSNQSAHLPSLSMKPILHQHYHTQHPPKKKNLRRLHRILHPRPPGQRIRITRSPTHKTMVLCLTRRVRPLALRKLHIRIPSELLELGRCSALLLLQRQVFAEGRFGVGGLCLSVIFLLSFCFWGWGHTAT